MDLTVDNRLINKTTTNPEMDLFIKELSETLNRRQNDIFSKTICNEIYNDIPLANRYKNQIENKKTELRICTQCKLLQNLNSGFLSNIS